MQGVNEYVSDLKILQEIESLRKKMMEYYRAKDWDMALRTSEILDIKIFKYLKIAEPKPNKIKGRLGAQL